jgi:SNF2 family DNA or RNA helicase
VDVLAKLHEVRKREDISLPEAPNFRKTILDRHGRERPLELRGYQKQMVVHLMAMKRFVVGDDTGLGKTVETIASLCQLWRKDPDLKAVVLTKKSSVPQWEDEFNRFTEGVTVLLCVGSPDQRERIQRQWEGSTGPTVLIQGYTSACNDFSRMQNWRDYVLICDEATVFKSPSTRVHKICKHFSSQAGRCWGLTATLIKNTLMEGYGIYRVVVPDLFPMTPNAFMSNYCIVQMQSVGRGRQVPVIVGYRQTDIEKFREKIDLYYLGRPKHAVAKELPVLTTRDVTVGLTTWQQQKYLEALTGFLEHGDGEVREFQETAKLTSLIYCQEIANHPGLIEFHDYPSEKLDALVDMVTEGGDFYDEKVIVFTRFKTMVDIAIPVLEKAGVKCTRVTGDENEQARRAAMNAFQDPKSDMRVIFITMAGGDAINLQAAKAMVFYDTPWSAGDYIQILGRMIRIGSEHDRVYAVHLVSRGTIDEKVQAVVKKKMKLIEEVLGQRVKGEKGSDVVYDSGSETKDLYEAMIADARSRLRSK